ncbi:unnamed protein product [Euphydryas editha]|uniref:Uncharacterized protein n=1 Tax=Euphydryas editha TaxID=104508 RepID=A0AAU9V1K5_EUPED|nr:unnamed protein product [Euphydryas editha]
MRWSLYKNRFEEINTCEISARELKRKELEIKLKEKEVNEKLNCLQTKIKKFKKQTDHKTKKELAAAAKLQEARKKLLKSLSKNKVNKCRKCHKNEVKQRDKARAKLKNKKPPEDILHNFFDKIFKIDRNVNKLMEINSQDFVETFKRVLLQPYLAYPSSAIYNNCSKPLRPIKDQRSRWNASAGDCYLMSLRKTPQLWIYHRWPKFYPHYLDARTQWKRCGFLSMFLFGFLFWIPCFLCLEICKCLFCICCYDY